MLIEHFQTCMSDHCIELHPGRSDKLRSFIDSM